MYNFGIVSAFSKHFLSNVLVPSRSVFTNSPLNLNVTSVLYAEPLKKKKRMDPAIIRAREERRKKKLEKFIRRLEKHAQQLKPIAEQEIPIHMKDALAEGKIVVPEPTPEEKEEKFFVLKDWTRFKTREHRTTLKLINQLVGEKEKFLEELKKESPEKYEEAIQLNPNILPLSIKGPTHSPPIENYDAPDGEYYDITRKYLGET
ncbi:hypothetical protein TKK_0005963 [Trichogramma kaykai]|uniref:Large ribosomal subunit protein mL40 n=1 Tax=Trichogramma kaykai TaxID=54128 RepID=A0ABD2XGC7_9HYME